MEKKGKNLNLLHKKLSVKEKTTIRGIQFVTYGYITIAGLILIERIKHMLRNNKVFHNFLGSINVFNTLVLALIFHITYIIFKNLINKLFNTDIDTINFKHFLF